MWPIKQNLFKSISSKCVCRGNISLLFLSTSLACNQSGMIQIFAPSSCQQEKGSTGGEHCCFPKQNCSCPDALHKQAGTPEGRRSTPPATQYVCLQSFVAGFIFFPLLLILMQGSLGVVVLKTLTLPCTAFYTTTAQRHLVQHQRRESRLLVLFRPKYVAWLVFCFTFIYGIWYPAFGNLQSGLQITWTHTV